MKTDTQRKGPWRNGTEIGVLLPQTKEHLGPPETEMNEQGENLPSRSARSTALPTPRVQVLSCRTARESFCCVKLPSFWESVTGAVGKYMLYE